VSAVAGLILAAGESRRMGFPKALLEFRGETFLDGLIRTFGAHCSPVVVVLGAEAERIRAGLRAAAGAVIVENRGWKLGQITSMQCGLRAVPAEARGVLFTLVDHPNVRASTVAELVRQDGALAIPRYAGRRGHPIYFSRELAAEFEAVDPASSARVVLERHAGDIRYIDVDDPGILDDVDDPAAYRRLTTNYGGAGDSAGPKPDSAQTKTPAPPKPIIIKEAT
jgi:molybdenum cofactor cytidylyltransferase